MDPFTWLAGLGAAGTTTGAAAGTLAPLSAGASAAAAASTAAGITAGTIAPTVAGAAAGGGIGAAAAGAGKFLAQTAAGTGAAALLAPKPKIPGVVRPPTVDDARRRVEEQDRLRAKKGGAAAILTGKLGDTSPVQTATKTLLGQ